MPVTFTRSRPNPRDNFIVCAGTVTVDSVANMGSGFNTFKRTFRDNPNWAGPLNQSISAYHSGATMPAFQNFSQYGVSGGVATVPVAGSGAECDPSISREEQYKNAVRGAIDAARAAGKPLYIQPLGTGVYGWPQDKAAAMFAEVIAEDEKKHPNSPLNIKIPIYSRDDLQFQNALQSRLAALQSSRKQATIPLSPLQGTQPPPTAASANAKIVSKNQSWDKTLMAFKAYLEEKNCSPEESTKRLNGAKTDGKLTFDSPKDVTEFFSKQAKANQSFLAILVDSSDKPTGKMLLSCGTGKLYEGTAKEIHEALTADIGACKPGDPNRQALKDALANLDSQVVNQSLPKPLSQVTKEEVGSPEMDESERRTLR